MTTAWKELQQRKTIGRALLNVQLSRILSTLNGMALDLAGGGSGYARFLPNNVRLTRTDFSGDGLDALVDINEPLPYPDHSFDSVLLLNGLYIARDPKAVLAEIHRVLKSNGRLILSTPYLMAEMREPHDYCRFTSEWLEETLKELQYVNIRLIPIGERFTTIANLVDGFGTRLGKLITYPFAAFADSILPKHIRKEHPAPITYLTIASASGAASIQSQV